MRSSTPHPSLRRLRFLAGVRTAPGRHPEWLRIPDPQLWIEIATHTESLEVAQLCQAIPALRGNLSRNPHLTALGYRVSGLVVMSYENGGWVLRET